MNYARIEARYFLLDLMDQPLRKVLNLAFDWLVEAYSYDSDGWENTYARIFDRTVTESEYAEGHDEVDLDALGIDIGGGSSF